MSVIADLNALLLFCFLNLGLAFNLQAATVGFRLVSTAGRFTASATATMAQAFFAPPAFRGR